MAVLPADLLRPAGGELDAAWFTEESADLSALLTLWIAEGDARADAGGIVDAADVDALTAHHAYARAFDTLWTRAAAVSASASLEGLGSKSVASDQRATWKAKRDEHEGEAAALVAAAVAEEDASATTYTAPPQGSRTVTFTPVWY